jgi:hypothetical protein
MHKTLGSIPNTTKKKKKKKKSVPRNNLHRVKSTLGCSVAIIVKVENLVSTETLQMVLCGWPLATTNG